MEINLHRLSGLPCQYLLKIQRGTKNTFFDKAYELDEMPSDRNIPGESMNITKNEEIPKVEWKYTKQRARNIIIFRECMKHRLLYSAKVLSDKENNHYEEIIQRIVYSCGSFVIPTGHYLENVIFIPGKLIFRKDISSQ